MKKSIAIIVAAVCCCFISTVFAGPPFPGEIGISYVAGQVTLSWTGDNYWLQSSGSLSPGSWVNVSNVPAIKLGSSVVTLPVLASDQFFRLILSPYLPPPSEVGVEPEEDDSGDTWFALWWDAVPLAVSYNLYYAAVPNVNPSNYASLPEGGALTGLTTNYATIGNLVAGLQYYFVATAVSTSGQSAYSYPASAIFGEFATVSGTIYMLTETTNPIGEEVPGVTVTLSNLTQPQLSSQTVSDSDGYYGFPNQPAGTYQLCWSAPGFLGGCLANTMVVTNEPMQGEDLYLTNDGSGLIYGHVTLADGSVASQTDPFFGIEEDVVVWLGAPGQPPLQTATVDDFGNYMMAGLPLQNGLTLTASNAQVGLSTNVDITGIQEVDLALPETPPGIVALFATSNGVLVTQAPQGSEVLVTVAATNGNGTTTGLHYAWFADTGNTNLISVDSPSINWVLPTAPGYQTIYVLVSDDYGGYANQKLDISTDLGLFFVGQVVDTNDVPVVGASVSLNGLATTSDDAGDFSFLATNPTNIYTVVATQPGYVPCTMEFCDEYQNVQCVMVPEPPCQQFYSTANIYTFDAAQSELIIYSNSLVTASGSPPVEPVCVTLDTLDPCGMATQLSLSRIGVLNGTNVVLEFLAMADVEAIDATGAPLAILTNMPMDVNLAADTNCIDDLTNEAPSFWWYDEVAGVWRPLSGGVASGMTLTEKPAFNGRPPAPMPGPGVIGVGKAAPGIIVPPPAIVPFPVAAPPPAMETLVLNFDKTISLPVDVRILDSATGADLLPGLTVFDQMKIVTFVRAAVTIQVISPKEGPDVYPPTPLIANRTAIVQVQEAANVANNTVVTLSLNQQNPNLTAKKVSGSQQFLTFKYLKTGIPQIPPTYYSIVDPNGSKTTLANWKAANGFKAGDTASATFFNAGDLGFGRSMHVKVTPNSKAGGNDVAFYVSNFGTASDAVTNRNTRPMTVAMDYVANLRNANKRIIAFYAFNENGTRVNSVDLDKNGKKNIPNLCMVCHGGDEGKLKTLGTSKNAFGDMGSHFLPFDSDSYTYSDLPNQGLANQAASFEALNQCILTNTAPSDAVKDLIDGWYANGGFNGTYVTAGWMDPVNANVQTTYSEAFAISCRTCHVSRDGEVSFLLFKDLDTIYSPSVDDLVYHLNIKNMPMPNALRTFTIFWGSENANAKGLNAKPPPDQTLLLQSVLGLKGARPAP